MGKNYRIGTRTSPLALIQTEDMVLRLRSCFPDAGFGIVGIDTSGDKDRKTPVCKMEGTDFFTGEIDAALLEDKIDMAVHSAKDLPDEMMEGLTVAAITLSIDLFDVLVSKNNLTLEKLPYGAKIGTSSTRRKKQLKVYREDLEIIDIRGNINDRMENLQKSDLDGIVIASAGLIRLGREDEISQRIPLEIMKTHPLQGALALVVRSNEHEVINALSRVSWNVKQCNSGNKSNEEMNGG